MGLSVPGMQRERQRRRKVRTEHSHERFVAAMRREATAEEGGRGGGEEREVERGRENKREGHGERGGGDKGMRGERRSEKRGGLRECVKSKAAEKCCRVT